MKAVYRSRIPPESAAVMTDTTAKLAATGIINMALGRGQKAPGFELRDWQDNGFKSVDILARGPLILTFYRGSW